MTAVLEVSNLEVSYGGVAAVRGLSMRVEAGSVVALLGANGAGKSSTLRAISGLVEVGAGSIRLMGEETVGMGAEAIARRGIAHVPEGRGIFAGLTVAENLRMARYGAGSLNGDRGETLQEVFEFFPVLKERSRHAAGTLSGGQQQQLAIARALLQRPRLLLLDEPSLGLAPRVVADVLSVVGKVKQRGMAVLLVEQFVREALKVADRAAVMEQGRIVLDGPVAELSANRIASAYLGGEKAAVTVGTPLAGRGREMVSLTLPGSRVRELERAASASGRPLDELVEEALARPARGRPPQR